MLSLPATLIVGSGVDPLLRCKWASFRGGDLVESIFRIGDHLVAVPAALPSVAGVITLVPFLPCPLFAVPGCCDRSVVGVAP